MSKDVFLRGMIVGNSIVLDDPRLRITPQPEVTSPRIKELLSKGLMEPEKLTPAEVREMTAAVVYHLIMKKR